MNFDELALKSHELRSGSILDLFKRHFIDCKLLLSNPVHVCVEVYRDNGRCAFLILDRFPLAEPNLRGAIEFAKLFIAGNIQYKNALKDTLVIEEQSPSIVIRFLAKHRLITLSQNGTLRLLSFSEEQLNWSHTSWSVHISDGGHIVEGVYLCASIAI